MNNLVYVWDRFVRCFHWSLVAAFATAYLTGDEDSLVHVYAGYCIGILILARVMWGFVGTPHARFSDFVRAPAAVLRYLRGFVGGPQSHYLGHNPAGGWMVILLLLCIGFTVVTGLRVYGIEGHGPLAMVRLPKPDPATMTVAEQQSARAARRARHQTEEFWEEIHEAAANVTLGLIVLHVIGVAASSLRHRENLTRAMITGYKRKV